MADRRADDTPQAARGPLTGPSRDDSDDSDGQETRAVPATVNVTGAAASQSAGDRSSAPPTTGRGSTSGAASLPSSTGSSTTAAPSRSSAAQKRPRGTRRARLRLVHLDPWSVMKTALLLSIALGIVMVVAVFVVWSVLDAAGVWDSINKTVTDVLGSDSAQNFDVTNYVGTSRAVGFTMFVAAVDVLLITAISTLGAFLYNLAAALLGGIEVTLAEDEH
jgi:hypothetical protein